MKIKGFFEDIRGASRVTELRRENFREAPDTPIGQDPIRKLSDQLHPGRRPYYITDIRKSSETAKTFRFEPADGHIPPFQAGQYVSFSLAIGSSVLTRPYSISSAPYQARGQKPFFEVTIRRKPGGFASEWFLDRAEVGMKLEADLPFGQFYYEPIRDAPRIVAIAGGAGITPFVSMAKEIAWGNLDLDLTILYGSKVHTDIVCAKELADAENTAREKRATDLYFKGSVKTIPVMEDDPWWPGESGLITRELIERYSDGDTSYFFCGPQPMLPYVSNIMKEMGVSGRRFRKDTASQPVDVSKIPGFPKDQIGKTYKITVVRGIREDEIPARADEPVAVSLERAGIKMDTHCRGGECGYCRSRLLSGDLFVSPLGDGRRAEDKEMGWFHACSSYPMSDVKIKIAIL